MNNVCSIHASPTSLSATVASMGIGHLLDLGRYLAARGMLAAYYTVMPASRTPGIPSDAVRRQLALGVALYANMRGWFPVSRRRVDLFLARALDRWASRHLVESSVAHAAQGLGYHTGVARERFGALAVCEASTSHFRSLVRLLTAEHAKWGAPFESHDHELAALEQEYAESDLIIVPSRFSYDSFRAAGLPASKLALVPYGFDLDAFQPVPRRDNVFRILFVGALTIRKGVPYLLEALAPLRWPDAELSLRGNDTPEIRELLSRYRGTIPITRVPVLPRSQLKELYSGASVLVLPSIEDAFGLVINQALACGTPVIATTHTGGPDVIEHGVNGFLVPPADSAALRNALTAAYEDRPMLARMGAEARRRVEQVRGWTTYGDRVVAAWRHALDARDGARRDVPCAE